MNGANVFGWLKTAAVFVVVLILIFVLYKFVDIMKGLRDFLLSDKNPAKAAGDKIATAVTGREESIGGMIADWINPATRAVNKLYRKPATPDDPFAGQSNMPGDVVYPDPYSINPRDRN